MQHGRLLVGLIVACLCWTLPSHSLAQATRSPAQLGPLEALLDQYLNGDADQAVRALAAWSPKQLRDSKVVPASAGAGWVSAARALMHYEASRQSGADGRVQRELADGYLADLDESTRPADGPLRAMHRDLHLLMGVRGDSWEALRDRFPQDPLLVLAHGRFLEYWSPRIAASQGNEYGFMIGEPVMSTDHGKFGPEIHQAEAAFRSVLKLAPAMVEARVRLGRVLWMQDRRRDAMQELTQAAAEAPPLSPEWAYLAHVFLGQIHEEGSRTTDAADAYRAALRILPGGQVAALRLGRVLVDGPAASDGWRLMSESLRLDRSAPDPWLLYASERSLGIEGDARARTLRNRLRREFPR